MRGILRNHQPDGRRLNRRQARLFNRRVSDKAGQASGRAAGDPEPGATRLGTSAAPAGAQERTTPTASSPAAELAAGLDYAAQRVRAAGGPTDEASYSCACGYVFDAPVSTSVRCPHCGSEQDW